MTNLTKYKVVENRDAVDDCGISGVPIDFEIKIVNPKANEAPALHVRSGTEVMPVALLLGRNNTWHGGICASRGSDLRLDAICRVNKDGSMTIQIKEPDFRFPAVKIKPTKGVCEVRGLKYPVG